MLQSIKSYFHLAKTYPTQRDCIEMLELMLWNGTPVSPFDAESTVYKCKDNKYRCRNTGKYFNVLKGTMFEGTKLSLPEWFYAIWKITTSGSGITSVDLAVDMGVTQKTAWFLLHRIRANFSIENNHVLNGQVETDEAWIGGKNKNRHKAKKAHYKSNMENPDKTVVLGMKQRGGKIIYKVVPDRSKESLQPMVQKYVANGANLITDELSSYHGLSVVYNHTTINHSLYEYVSKEDTTLTNNRIEGEWRILKRSVSGTYCHVADKHLQSYLDEAAYRANVRDLTESDKFYWLISNCKVHITYRELISRSFVKNNDSGFRVYRSKGKSNPDMSIKNLEGSLTKFKRNEK